MPSRSNWSARSGIRSLRLPSLVRAAGGKAGSRSAHSVGSSRAVPIDVRVVAATHKDLARDVEQGRFREDLYYRLNVLPCQTTALRERTDDIPDLLDFYAARHAADGQDPIRFGEDLLQALLAYAWPGNVRELSNLVDRFTTLFPGRCVALSEIPQAMLPPGLRALAGGEAPPSPAAAPVARAAAPMPAPVPVIGADTVGDLTSVGWSPLAGACVGLAYVRGALAQQPHEGTPAQVELWGEQVPVRLFDQWPPKAPAAAKG